MAASLRRALHPRCRGRGCQLSTPLHIAPRDQHFIVTSEFERRKAQRARWGLVNRWAKDNSRASQCINAKAETIEQRSTFREAFQQRRCVVPAGGFYE